MFCNMDDDEDINVIRGEGIYYNSDVLLKSAKDLNLPSCVLKWTEDDVSVWLRPLINNWDILPVPGLTGELLLLLRECDIQEWLKNNQRSSIFHRKALYHSIRKLQLANVSLIEKLGYDPKHIISGLPPLLGKGENKAVNMSSAKPCEILHDVTKTKREDGRATTLRPELWKTFISLSFQLSRPELAGKVMNRETYPVYFLDWLRLIRKIGLTEGFVLVYLFVVTWITAFVMVIVHNRVPDMKKYPPLPDIFLDNVPHIPWAFAMCEFTATLLLLIWIAVLTFHKHRFILMRRFFALNGTVFLLRCVTMLITSLSVPGSHLQCFPMAEEVQREESVRSQMQQAYVIWSGAGLSIKGVRTCGDYMFSGHTAALTLLNFFITEYTPRHLYFMHTFSWVLNMFGIFFILSAHEHYSIDVFIAFYITSRLFLYYHTLANNQALMQRDSTRTRIWFPLFSFFESEIDGIIPNEFDTPSSLLSGVMNSIKNIMTFFYTISMRRPYSRTKDE